MWFRGSLRFCCLSSLLFLLLFRGPCLLFGGLLRGLLPKIGLMAGPLDSVSGTREFESAKAFSYVILDTQYTYAPDIASSRVRALGSRHPSLGSREERN
ncbi:hypothetical protein D4R54_01860 [archaeon]|nr:MAG: hypothetical protein D4R54_01860 [archaeon]